MKKHVKLELEIIELESKLAPQDRTLDGSGTGAVCAPGDPNAYGAEC